MRLENATAMVTGAGSGIGRATSLAFAAEGAAVMCADIDEDSARETASLIVAAGGRSAAQRLDVTDEADVQRALEATVRELGGLSVLFNNAGIAGAGWAPTLAVNLTGVYLGLKHGAPLIEAQGGGSIVNTSSVAGLVALSGGNVDAGGGEPLPAEPGAAPYVASKHGVVGLTRQFAVHYARRGVRVNCINPGYVDTAMIGGITASEQGRAWYERQHPMGRLGRPEEIAAAAVFLASDEASFVTGAALVVDGGYTAR